MTDSAHHRPMGAGGIILALLVNIMFALNVVAAKVVVDATAPLTAVSVRMALVFLCCLPMFRIVPGKTGWLAAYGALNGGLFLLVLNLSLMIATNVGALAIAGQLSVPFSLILGALIFREKLSRPKLLGVFIAFAGVVLLVFDPAIATEIPAVLTMAGAAFLWGAGTLIQRKLTGVSALNTQAWNGLMGGAILLPFALIFEPRALGTLPHIGGEALGFLAFSVVGCTVVGQGLLAWLLQRYPIGTIMPLMLASPVMATLFASLWFGTVITPIMIAGGLIALAGVAFIVTART